MKNFADIVRTHYFDYYPHVTDTEQNEKFMRIIDQTSILEKIKKIHPSDNVDKFKQIAEFNIQSTFDGAFKPGFDQATINVSGDLKK